LTGLDVGLLSVVAILAVALMDAWLRVIRLRNGTRVLESDLTRMRREPVGERGELRALLAEVLQELVSLRGELVASGVAERSEKLPPPAASPPALSASPLASTKPPPLPSVLRKVVSVTTDDHPDHTRATVVAPPPAGTIGSNDDEPPSTKPSESRSIPASTAPQSLPRPVSFDDQLRRALARMEKSFKVPPELEQRWLARLRTLGAELNLREGDGPTDEQAEVMIRELYTGEDLTTLYSRCPSAADTRKPITLRPPHWPPRKVPRPAPREPQESHKDGGDTP
jgi:hypothetical protein